MHECTGLWRLPKELEVIKYLTALKHLRQHRFPFRSVLALSCMIPVGALVLLAVALLPPLQGPEVYLAAARSGEMLDRSGHLLHAFLNEADHWCFPRSLEAFSPRLVQATIAAEDKRFYRHTGVDLAAIVRAALQNFRRGKVASGASTLTMQVVKLGDRTPRTLWGKATQMLCALRLERSVSKDAILEAYLNRAPYGLNLLGAEAAARRYFGKPALELTLSEAALLAALPKGPAAYQPFTHPDRAMARRNYVLRRMRKEGYITDSECEAAVTQPLGVAWHEHPRLAPHLAMRLRERIQREGAVRVTLDGDLQARLERMLLRYLKRFDNEVTNAAVMVVDVASAEVIARVASANFFDALNAGQVDMCEARRSPGSTLKPFTYGFAIEANCLYATERLLDDALDLGRYHPENFDGEHYGLVSVKDALRHSLNIPAVITLNRLGVQTFLERLHDMGLSTPTKSAQHYGLGLTLGNCEVRLDEMTAAYRMIADLGRYQRLRILADTPESAPPRQLLSPGTACILYEMMEQPFPCEPDDSLIRARGAPARVCWKTGTSAGYRDAWTFAFNRQYVVGVWLGNNDARPSRRLVGARAALPLAAAIFRSLSVRSAPTWPDTRNDMKTVSICVTSGLPASPACPAVKSVEMPRAQYLHRRCDVHHPRQGGGVIVRWPGAPLQWDLARVENPVALDTDQKNAITEERRTLCITSPSDQARYVLTGEPDGDRIRLAASLEERAALHWYLNDRYLGQSDAASPLFLSLETGVHKLSCMDPGGATHSIQFEVLTPVSGMRLKN